MVDNSPHITRRAVLLVIPSMCASRNRTEGFEIVDQGSGPEPLIGKDESGLELDKCSSRVFLESREDGLVDDRSSRDLLGQLLFDGDVDSRFRFC